MLGCFFHRPVFQPVACWFWSLLLLPVYLYLRTNRPASCSIAMSGRPSLRNCLQSELHPSVPEKHIYPISEAGTEGTDTTPSTLSDPTVLDTRRNDFQNRRGTSSVTGKRSVNAKVAIPRLNHPVAQHDPGRVSRACHNCHKQKNKCSGDRPSCRRCLEINVSCVYTIGKREKNAKCVAFLIPFII